MMNSSISHQAGLARINDLRLAADERRRACPLERQPDRSRSVNGHSRRGQLRRTLAGLKPPRAARA